MALPGGARNLQEALENLARRLLLRRSGVNPTPKPDHCIVFARKNGGGKMELCVQHPTGSVQVLSTEP